MEDFLKNFRRPGVDRLPKLGPFDCGLDLFPGSTTFPPMIRLELPLVLALMIGLAGIARGDRRELTESRHPTAMETRRYRAKAAEKVAAEDFRPMPRIVGGKGAADGEYPWMVALVEAGEADAYDGFFCGASLIHPRWVLTAAHCVLGSRAEDLEVLVGATNLANPGAARRIAVAEIVIAPGYNDFTSDQDFALLRLAEAAEGTVLPLLDDPALAMPGILATVTGWGDTTNGDRNFPTRLQEVEVPIVDIALANASDAYAGTLTGNMLAAGFGGGGKDACNGDSGGPLLVPSPFSPGWMQAGIVSFGSGCALPGVYGIYTQVGNFRDFITGHLRPNYAGWELENDRVGENRDPDGNGFSNWEDFALPGHQLQTWIESSKLRFSYVRPTIAPEAEYVLENAPGPGGPWTALSPNFVSVVDQGGGLSRWTYELPQSADTGVFRVRAGFSAALAPGPRPLGFPGGAVGRLDEDDVVHPVFFDRRIKLYRLDGAPAGTSVSLALRSADFDARLELIDGASGAVLQVADANQGLGRIGGDEILTLTPQAGTTYHLRVTSSAPDQAGDFELNAWDAGPLDLLPSLSAVQSVAGKLDAADALDPFFLPGGSYYKDDYRLVTGSAPAGAMLEIRMKSKGSAAKGIDDFVALIDGESGRLIAGNDSFLGKGNDAGLRFLPVPGKSYVLRASSGIERDIGRYTLGSSLAAAGTTTPLAAIGVGGTLSGKLTGLSELEERYFTFKRDHLLAPAVAGQPLSVSLSSLRFDAYLIILDASDLTVVAAADGGGPPGGRDNAGVTFTPRTGRRYLIRATTYEIREKGPYILSVAAAP